MAADQQQPAVAVASGGGGSRFAVTCGLLRQYMKEQGGNGARCLAPAVAMGLVPAEEPEERKPVLELFPQQAGTLKDEHNRKRKEPTTERAPLTIFYGGKMVVFDDFPAEKAEEIMHLAGGSGKAAENALAQPNLTGTNAYTQCSVRSHELAPKETNTKEFTVFILHTASELTQHLFCARFLSSDMPIARKASLKRFLEKRKNRLTAGDPYPVAASESTKPAAVKKEEGAPWLGVSSALTLS
ncbi:unnamed protein product [Urochloa decumbens]|uniref:Protein TIFY n=1 Tax=Urochloa decumbens TaxID=240449 RepID=A0ABC8XSB9_9POAL